MNTLHSTSTIREEQHVLKAIFLLTNYDRTKKEYLYGGIVMSFSHILVAVLKKVFQAMQLSFSNQITETLPRPLSKVSRGTKVDLPHCLSQNEGVGVHKKLKVT